jgi:hypothetical protein
MIAYDLECGQGHSFEGWFEDHKAFAEQKRKNLVSCPVCNDTSVAIVPSAFSIKSCSTQRPERDKSVEAGESWEPEKITRFLDEHFEDVGIQFASEALKMHYGVSQKRNIKGTSTDVEEKMLER